MKVSQSDQTPALGAAIFAAVAAGKENGGYTNVEEAQQAMTGSRQVYNPIAENHAIYKELYKLYKQLHDGFGTSDNKIDMYNVMKDLLDIRDQASREN
jgi:L-ribulokinase